MNTNILLTASALSDQDLLARLEGLAGKEREASAELVAHLAALDSRQMLYAAQGYGSLFSYCTRALRLSEDAACNRIEAARACRRFPLILGLLASGSLSLTSVRLLAPHLTVENHQSVLAKAIHKTRREIEALVAELAPRRDLPSTVRKVPCRAATRQSWAALAPGAGAGPGLAPGTALGLTPGTAFGLTPGTAFGHAPGTALGLAPATAPGPGPTPGPAADPAPGPAMSSLPSAAGTAIAPAPGAQPAPPRPIVQASAPTRYRVQFTVGEETHEKLRRLQALLRREIPDGDPGAIFDRALTVLLEKVEKRKLAVPAQSRPSRPIRPAADREVASPGLPSRGLPPASPSRTVPAPPSRTVPPAPLSRTVPPAPLSRHVPGEVKREVWRRDAGQCAFVSSTGRRCMESTFLEFHHILPYAKQGLASVANISLRCRRHNQYEADVIFGPRASSIAQGFL